MKIQLILLAALLTSCGNYAGVWIVDGVDGKDGTNGYSTVFSTAPASTTQCVNGGHVLMVGLDVNQSNDLDLDDLNIQTLVTCNGLNGANGSNGLDAPPTAFTPTAILNPCGDAPSVHDEVFLKLADGTILASFSDNANGNNTRFSILLDGTYQTTDGDACIFTLSGGSIVYENKNY